MAAETVRAVAAAFHARARAPVVRPTVCRPFWQLFRRWPPSVGWARPGCSTPVTAPGSRSPHGRRTKTWCGPRRSWTCRRCVPRCSKPWTGPACWRPRLVQSWMSRVLVAHLGAEAPPREEDVRLLAWRHDFNGARVVNYLRVTGRLLPHRRSDAASARARRLVDTAPQPFRAAIHRWIEVLARPPGRACRWPR